MLSFHMTPKLAQTFFQAFTHEVALQGGFQSELKEAEALGTHALDAAKKIAPHVPAMLVGAGGVLGAKRLKDDIQTGEAMRRQGY